MAGHEIDEQDATDVSDGALRGDHPAHGLRVGCDSAVAVIVGRSGQLLVQGIGLRYIDRQVELFGQPVFDRLDLELVVEYSIMIDVEMLPARRRCAHDSSMASIC